MSISQLLQNRQQLIRVKHALDKHVDVSVTGRDGQAYTQSWQFRLASSEFAQFVLEVLPQNTVYVKVGEQSLKGYYLYQNQTMDEPEQRVSIAEPGSLIPLTTVELPTSNSFEETYVGCKHIMLGCQAIIASHSSLHVGESEHVQHDFILQHKKIRPLTNTHKS